MGAVGLSSGSCLRIGFEFDAVLLDRAEFWRYVWRQFCLFGYIWMKSKFDPTAGLYMDQRTVFLMLLWLVVCFTGWIGPVANGGHVGELIAGMIFGYAPKLLRR